MSRDLPMMWRNTGDTNISLLSAPCWTSVLSYRSSSHEIGPRSPHVPCHIVVQLAVRILRVRWSVPSLFLRKWLVDAYGWACWSEGPHGNRSQTHACVSVCRSLPTGRFCHRPLAAASVFGCLKKNVTQSISSYIQGKRPAPKRSAVEKRRVYEVGESASVSVTVRPPCPGHWCAGCDVLGVCRPCVLKMLEKARLLS